MISSSMTALPVTLLHPGTRSLATDTLEEFKMTGLFVMDFHPTSSSISYLNSTPAICMPNISIKGMLQIQLLEINLAAIKRFKKILLAVFLIFM